MHIAVFADNFLPQINGVVTATLTIINGLAARGHRITVFAPKYRGYTYPHFHENISVVPILSVPAPFYKELKLSLAPPAHPVILKRMLGDRPDVVHFHTPMPLGFQALLVAKALRKPLVGTFHTYFGHSEYLKHAKLDFAIVQRMAWEFTNLQYNRCDVITTPSQVTKRDLVDHGCRVPVKVISNGINFKSFSRRGAAAVRKKYGGGPLLLFVGRVAREKNILSLLKSFTLIAEQVPKAKLLVVGDGPQFAETKASVRKMGLGSSVHLLGAIPHDKLIDSGILAAPDVFVSMSETETQGITMMEALANTVPCVCVRAGGLQDVVKHRKNGLLAPPGDVSAFAEAVILLLKDKELRKKLSTSCADSLKNHETSFVLDKWERLYKSL